MALAALLLAGGQPAWADDGSSLEAGQIPAAAAGQEQDAAPAIDLSSLDPAGILVYDSYDDDSGEYAIADATFTGAPAEPQVTVAIADGAGGFTALGAADYALAYEDNLGIGDARVVISGQGAYTGTVSKGFRVVGDLSRASVKRIASKTYNAKAQKPRPAVSLNGQQLALGRDFTVKYQANKNAGKAKVVLSGTGYYTGTKTVKFTIKKAPIKKAKVSGIANQKKTGAAITPKPKVKANGKTLKLGRDYTLSYRNNVNAGTAQVIVKGKGNYKGSKVVKFKIEAPAPKAATAAATVRAAASRSVAAAATEPLTDTVYITNTGAKYHRGTCRWLYASKIPISRSEAIARGYDACKVCHP